MVEVAQQHDSTPEDKDLLTRWAEILVEPWIDAQKVLARVKTVLEASPDAGQLHECIYVNCLQIYIDSASLKQIEQTPEERAKQYIQVIVFRIRVHARVFNDEIQGLLRWYLGGVEGADSLWVVPDLCHSGGNEGH